jgi:cytochrome P450/NADPH-cytochrome P450 reductase
MQEATLVLGMLLQRFQLIDHKHYQLKIKQTLTIKPENFTIQVKPRTDIATRVVVLTPTVQTEAPAAQASVEPPTQAAKAHHTPLLVLYGSNLGTCEDLAERIAADGKAKGFTSATAPLDNFVHQLPKEGAVVIVTASYNGTPPDNAVEFCR